MEAQDLVWMQHALELAKVAEQQQEVPVGAVVVFNNEIVGRGYNQCIGKCDPTAHAEVVAMREAAEKIGNYRLVDTKLYVTLEPCVMCAGAIVHARVNELVFGAQDFRAGAVITQTSILNQTFLNHRVSFRGGLLADDCAALLKNFFQVRR